MQISADQARRSALQAAGFGQSGFELVDLLGHLGVFQLDTVNVFQRAHLMPAFSRIGPISPVDFESLAFGAAGERQMEEAWAHCAALIPQEDYHLFEFRRKEWGRRESFIKMLSEQRPLVDWVLKQIETNGPMMVSEFQHEKNQRKGDWWGWSDIKIILERLWFMGELASDGRTKFSRRYALPGQAGVAKESTLSEDQQKRTLIKRSVLRLGVGTLDDVADYYRFYPTEVKPILQELVDDGTVLQVQVEGWEKPAYAHADFTLDKEFTLGNREVRLLSPFDPLVWKRDRLKRIFNFDYQIEIYVPEAKRKFGYYCLPILYRDQIVGRVDLKHDRKARVLEVKSLWQEGMSGKEQRQIGSLLATELNLAATWVGAEKVNPPEKGNWALGRI